LDACSVFFVFSDAVYLAQLFRALPNTLLHLPHYIINRMNLLGIYLDPFEKLQKLYNQIGLGNLSPGIELNPGREFFYNPIDFRGIKKVSLIRSILPFVFFIPKSSFLYCH
jgi:hypothetical protein